MKDRIKGGYYYPLPEEIRVGMEIEVFDYHKSQGPKTWCRYTVCHDYSTEDGISIHAAISCCIISVGLDMRHGIRIPLLTREQIEAEGWEPMTKDDVEDWSSPCGKFYFSQDKNFNQWFQFDITGTEVLGSMEVCLPTIYHFRAFMEAAQIEKEVKP